MFNIMKMPRVSNLIIIGQFVLLLICLGCFGYALANNYCLKLEAKKYAEEAGFAEATHNFLRGDFCLYELKLYKFDFGPNESGTVPTDGTTESTDKMDGKFHVLYFLVSQHGFEYGHQEIQRAFVDGYNQHMRQYFEHPEWFNENGQRIPLHESKQQANTSSALP
jgi:hypothetical protein